MDEIPRSVTVNTGEQGNIIPLVDDFFKEIVDYVRENYKAEERFFQIKTGEIAYDSLTPVVTDDRITYLLYKQRVLATVLETRTELNYVHYDFFKNLDGLEDLVLSK